MTAEVLYIGGASRSGTTLLERILGLLPDTQTLGEVRHLWIRGVLENQLCGCGASFHECKFWSAVGEKAFGGWTAELGNRIGGICDRQDRSRRIPAMVARQLRGTPTAEMAQYAGAYGRLYAAAAEVSGRRVVIDSSKHVSQPFALMAGSGVRLRIVHVVRDPRGVAYSWSKSVVRPEITGATQLMDRMSAAEVALDWDVQNGLFALTRPLGIPRLVVRYEDLLAAPATAIAVIGRWAGLEMPDAVLNELSHRRVTLQAAHSAAGNPMRFRSGPVDLREDAEWRQHMRRRDRRLVSTITGPLAAVYRRRIVAGGQR
jgi:hypothetical protein